MPSFRTLASLALVITSLVGCKPAEEQPPAPIAAEDAAEAFARQICNGIFTCTCSNAPNYASIEVCVDELSADFQTQIQERLDQGADWNAECAGQLVAAWSQWECLGPAAAQAQAFYDRRLCPVLKGSIPAGGNCVLSTLGDDCAPGLQCMSGTCVATTVPVPVGLTCNYDWQELPCEEGSYCGYDTNTGERVCKRHPVAGDVCTWDEGYLCGPGSLGLVCNYETMTCEPLPGVGEACFDGFYCGVGSYCDGGKDFTCQARFDIGDSCGADAVCPADSSCVGNVCEADPAAVCGLLYLGF